MTLIRSLDDLSPARGGVLSIGNFDGVHRGHQTMITRLAEIAQAASAPAVVLTFDPHPIQLLAPEKAPPSLSTLERKSELLHEAGADHVVAFPTTRDLLGLEATTFFEQIVCDALAAVGMVEGPNFHFGRNRGGDVSLLQSLCDRHGLTCDILEPVEHDGAMISSSLVRAAITGGHLADAVQWLGHPYRLCGIVTHGDARGRTLGFPTANLSDVATLLPPDGVYAAVCRVAGRTLPAAINIGGNPTFGVDERKVEAHIVDFDGDLYGQALSVDLIARVRGTRSFDSGDELVNQLQADIARVREFAERFLTPQSGSQSPAGQLE